jgi:serine/threonine protein kinase
MAPERLLDPRSIDPRTDLYGIGCIGFYLLAGRKPFEARADADLSQQVLHVPAPAVVPLSPFPVPEALAALIGGCLEKDMAQRPASAQVMIEALAPIARQVPWRRERAKLWWASVFPERAAGSGSG